MNLKKSVEDIRSLAEDARALSEDLKSLVKDDPEAETTARDRKKLQALIKKTEDTRRAFKAAAKAERAAKIADLKTRVQMINSTLNTPGLSVSARNDLKDLLDTHEAELVRLQNMEATDFTDLLPQAEQEEIDELLARAKEEVNEKRRAADVLVVAVKAADVALTIAGKLAKAAIV